MSLHKKAGIKPNSNNNLKFSNQELEVLLFLISNGTFSGKDLEVMYKLAHKLHSQLSKQQEDNDKLNKSN